ncbi:MAG: hypothetical protein WDM84_01520 [Bauldia sp.]
MLAAIRQDLESMRTMIEGGARQATLGALEDRHEGIAARLDDPAARHPAPTATASTRSARKSPRSRRALEDDDSPRAVQRLEMRVAELGRAIEAALSSRHPDPAVERLEGRLEDIAGRIESLRDSSAHIAAIETVEQRLDSRLTEIAERLGNFLDPAPQAAAIRTVEQRLDKPPHRDRRAARQLPRPGAPRRRHPERRRAPRRPADRPVAPPRRPHRDDAADHRHGGRAAALQDSIDEIAGRLGTMVENATRPQTLAIETAQRKMEDRLEEIVDRLGGLSDNAQERAAIEHVHERLLTISERIERLNSSQREPSAALDAIKSEIGSLRKEVAGSKIPPADIDAIRHEIGTLRQEVAGSQVAPAEFDAIHREIGTLRREVTSQVPSGDIDANPPRDRRASRRGRQQGSAGAKTDHLEAQIRDLARQLETVAGAKDDGPALAALEAQVARLTGELEQTKPQVHALHQVEETLDRGAGGTRRHRAGIDRHRARRGAEGRDRTLRDGRRQRTPTPRSSAG